MVIYHPPNQIEALESTCNYRIVLKNEFIAGTGQDFEESMSYAFQIEAGRAQKLQVSMLYHNAGVRMYEVP